MTRRLLNLLTLLSLLLCVAAVVMWVRGSRRHDYLTYARPGTRYYLHWGAGRVEFTRAVSASVNVTRREFAAGSQSSSAASLPNWDSMYPDDGGRTAFGGAIFYHVNRPDLRFQAAIVPLSWLALASAIGPAVALRRRLILRRRTRAGLCPKCGYDLRATPGRCPECGREPASARQDPVVPPPAAR